MLLIIDHRVGLLDGSIELKHMAAENDAGFIAILVAVRPQTYDNTLQICFALPLRLSAVHGGMVPLHPLAWCTSHLPSYNFFILDTLSYGVHVNYDSLSSVWVFM